MISIEILLHKYGPSPSSKLKRELLNLGFSDEAARQKISRSRHNIRRLTSLPLPKREAFLYLDQQYGSPIFWNNLLHAHIESNSAYGTAMSSMIAKGGIIPEKYFHIISGSPLKLKKHLSSLSVLENLIATKFLKYVEINGIGNCIKISAQDYLEYDELTSIQNTLVIDDLLLTAVYDWARKLGLASYDAIKKKDLYTPPQYGQFHWDITAPSYIHPFTGFSNNKKEPGFIAIDVSNAQLDVQGVGYFLKKCSISRSIKGHRPFLAVLIAEGFSKEAFQLGKSAGLIFSTPDIILGKETAKSIRLLAQTLENAAAVAIKNPEQISTLLNSLSSIEGAALNIRGALFELVVAHIVQKGEGGSIDIGTNLRTIKGQKAEVDIRRVLGEHEVTLYECKGHQPSTIVDVNSIEHWISSRIPVIRAALMEEVRFKSSHFVFEYWTSGEFSPEALRLLEETSSKTKKYALRWKGGKDILSYAKKIKSKSMVDTLKQHYTHHPLTLKN